MQDAMAGHWNRSRVAGIEPLRSWRQWAIAYRASSQSERPVRTPVDRDHPRDPDRSVLARLLGGLLGLESVT